jgi:hypothetical protein
LACLGRPVTPPLASREGFAVSVRTKKKKVMKGS